MKIGDKVRVVEDIHTRGDLISSEGVIALIDSTASFLPIYVDLWHLGVLHKEVPFAKEELEVISE